MTNSPTNKYSSCQLANDHKGMYVVKVGQVHSSLNLPIQLYLAD